MGKIGGFLFGGGGGEEEEGEVGDEVEAEGQEVSSLVSDREVDITIDDVKNIDEIDYIWDCAADSEEEEEEIIVEGEAI